MTMLRGLSKKLKHRHCEEGQRPDAAIQNCIKTNMTNKKPTAKLKRIGIDTYHEPVIYMRQDSPICLSEGLKSQTRVNVELNGKTITATLDIITSDILGRGEAGLSEYAWKILNANDGDEAIISHSDPVLSLSFVRSKIYGNDFSQEQIHQIVFDIANGKYSDVQIAAFLAACGGNKMNKKEVTYLTKAMIDIGEKLIWDEKIIVDKHSVGGLPGNRTTPIIVAIVAEFGLKMPKTSSRSITSPAGTADTMEVLAPVELTIEQIKKIIKEQNGCVAWGGSVSLSPADDILIMVERSLNLDSEGQMVASILSKKIAAGSNHILIDIPIGETAKVRTMGMAKKLKKYLENIGKDLNVVVKVIFSDGSQPVGKGIGLALEARDVLLVLQNDPSAPGDLRAHSLRLAGEIIEFSPQVRKGRGLKIATEILNSGKAWERFQAICAAQGGMREIPTTTHQYQLFAQKNGTVNSIDNRQIALVAKLAGAPADNVAGVDINVKIGNKVKVGDVLLIIYAASAGTLEYAVDYLLEVENKVIRF
jgi:thymidine phosphorylase